MTNNDNIEYKKINDKLDIIYDDIKKNFKIVEHIKIYAIFIYIAVGLNFIANFYSLIFNSMTLGSVTSRSNIIYFISLIIFIIVLTIYSYMDYNYVSK